MDATIFTQLDWCRWLLAVARNTAEAVKELPGPVETDLRLRLLDFYETLGGATKLDFEEGLTLAFQSTPPRPNNAETLRFLLALLSYCTPASAKQVVRQRLLSGTLWKCHVEVLGEDRPKSVQTLALSTAAAFGMDELLARYVSRSWESTADFEFRLTAFRLLSRYREQPAVDLLIPLIGTLESKDDARRLMNETLSACDRFTYAQILDWYLEFAIPLLHPAEKSWRLMQAEWDSAFKPVTPPSESTDPAFCLLTFMVAAFKAQMKAKDILKFLAPPQGISDEVFERALALILENDREFVLIDPCAERFGNVFKKPAESLGYLGWGTEIAPVPATELSHFRRADAQQAV